MMMDAGFTVERDGRALYRDEGAHVALVLRTLGIDEALFRRVLDDWAARLPAGGPTDLAPTMRLDALKAAWARHAPHAALLPVWSQPPRCPICDGRAVRPLIARAIADAPPLVYGRCAACTHAPLVEGAAPASVYESERYFAERDAGGAGYTNYAGERAYREAKAHALFDWIEAAAGVRPPGALLEVGSGFGFTRRAATERGFVTAGVDTNPHAVRAARELYAFETVRGTLADALAAGAVAPAMWDLVLYQFVLEHVSDPVAELRRAAGLLAPGGALALVVPSADAVELEVFGASYRSLRADHLHLFPRASLRRALAAAGLEPVALTSTCSLHLLAGFLDDAELAALYESGRGPDLRVLARRRIG